MSENELSKIIIGCCIEIHRRLGPGLLESVYEEILYYELTTKYLLNVTRQQAIPVFYDEIKMEVGFRADLIVENKVLIELKSIEHVLKVHQKKTLTYLRLTSLKLGLLINFNEYLLKDGVKRIVNNL